MCHHHVPSIFFFRKQMSYTLSNKNVLRSSDTVSVWSSAEGEGVSKADKELLELTGHCDKVGSSYPMECLQVHHLVPERSSGDFGHVAREV